MNQGVIQIVKQHEELHLITRVPSPPTRLLSLALNTATIKSLTHLHLRCHLLSSLSWAQQ